MIVVNGNFFETYNEAAEFLGISSGSLRNNRLIYCKKYHGFPIFVDGVGTTFQNIRFHYNMNQKTLDEILLGPKEFHFNGLHRLKLAKPVAILYDLKKLLKYDEMFQLNFDVRLHNTLARFIDVHDNILNEDDNPDI